MSDGRQRAPWYTRCRRQQEAWKQGTATLPDAARVSGTTFVDDGAGRKAVGPYPVCVPPPYADHNLLPSVRSDALARFRRHGIRWHGYTPGPDGVDWPCTHLLDSQVQCVNALLSLTQSGGLLDLVRQVEPEALNLDPVEDESPVAFEWIGAEDYLGEVRHGQRRRGEKTTSIDALLIARRSGGRTGIGIEWKYTESYDKPVPFRGRRRDRRDIYRGAYGGTNSPFAERPPIEAFFHEPHYQVFRQALLLSAMVSAGELGIDRAVLLHAVPAGNETLLRTITPELACYGDTIGAVWSHLLPAGSRVVYRHFDTAPMLQRTPELAERYGALARPARA